MIAELLRYTSGAATLAECPDSSGNDLPDLLGAGMVTALQYRHEQGIGPDGANTEVVHRWPHHEPPRLLVPLTTSPGPGTLDLYLAEHPGRLVIPASSGGWRGDSVAADPEGLRRAPQKSHKSASRVPARDPHGHDGIPRHTPALMLK
jgi:hypothetical protein